MKKHVIMAFTGGVQSSVCLHWLAHSGEYRVSAFAANLGQPGKLRMFGEHALSLGADKAHLEDVRDEFCRDYVLPALKAGAVYGNCYLLSGALARPLIADVMVRLAEDEACTTVAHGAGPQSSDLARFEQCIAALAPDMELIGPGQIPPLQTRQKAVDYARRKDIMPDEKLGPGLHMDRNLWGWAVEVDPLMDTGEELPEEVYQLTTNPHDSPDEPDEVEIGFERGEPVSLDGRDMDLKGLISELNDRAGRHGIGRTQVIEDGVAGIKAREVYERPAADVLTRAHTALEELVLDYPTLELKKELARRYGQVVYRGAWFSPVKDALDAFFESTQEHMTGQVTVELYHGSARVLHKNSPMSLYDTELARREREKGLDGLDVQKMWRLQALPYRVLSRVRGGYHKRGT
jgi:argininosuccinate synthase